MLIQAQISFTKVRCILYTSLCAIWISAQLTAQTGLPVNNVSDNYRVHFSSLNGLFEDDLGFLWFATEDGLSKFDGYKFQVYRHDVNDPWSISHHDVHVIAQDDLGQIWAGTTNGLSKLDSTGRRFTKFYLTPDTIQTKGENTITELGFDRDGTLWCAGYAGLFRFEDNKTFTRIDPSNTPMEGSTVTDLFLAPDGVFYCATTSGLFRLDKSPSHNFPFVKMHQEDLHCRQIAATTTGEVIFAAQSGVFKLDKTGGTVSRLPIPNSASEAGFYKLMIDDSNDLWLIDGNQHLLHVSKEGQILQHFTHLEITNGPEATDLPHAFLEDQQGVIWLVSSKAIYKYLRGYPNFQRLLRHPDKGKVNTVLRTLVASDNSIWTISEGKLGQLTHDQKFNIWDIGSIGSKAGDWLIEDANQWIWVGVHDEGLYSKRIDDSSFEKISFDSTFDQTYIYRLASDNRNPDILWAGTRDGLARLDTRKLQVDWFDPRQDIPGLPTSRVAIFDLGPEGDIWLYNTYHGSLSYFNREIGRFYEIKPPAGLQVLKGDVKDIAVDSANIWIATLFGLTRFNREDSTFHIFTSSDGLHASGVVSLLSRNNTLWMAGNQFIASLDKPSGTIDNYNFIHESIHFVSKSRYMDTGGHLYFGCTDGLLAFDPGTIVREKSAPRILITQFLVNDSLLVMTATSRPNTIKLAHHQNDVVFEFVGLDPADPFGSLYQCKLDGYDTEWRDLGNERLVRYTNLNPGNYTFSVIGSNGTSLKSSTSSVSFSITPAFWQTYWFRALIFMCLALIGYILVKIRQHQLTLQKERTLALRASEYKSNFLANVSHEIRTPLNAILGLSDLALEANDPSHKDEYLATISTSSKDMVAILNELLDHSKLEAGRFVFEEKDFSLHQLIRQVELMFEAVASQKDLAFRIAIPDADYTLRGDPKRLKQILANLLGNAIKFTAKGSVALQVQVVELDPTYVSLQLRISDTGSGIPEDQLARVFQRFETGSMGVDDTTASTGLGLHITRQLVERQGGSINLQSQVDRGTVVNLHIPFQRGKHEDDTLSESSEVYDLPETLHILVVEDSPVNQLLVSRLLNARMPNWEIASAEDGEVALDMIRHQDFDLILMDVKMPKMNGYQATRAIRAMGNAKKHIPIIGVTASAMPEQIEQCLESGMTDVVTKPISSEDLFAKIGSILKSWNNDR